MLDADVDVDGWSLLLEEESREGGGLNISGALTTTIFLSDMMEITVEMEEAASSNLELQALSYRTFLLT
ncbi:Mediator of RNA polymerase II transcription subunit 14 [Venturia inaequalis]|nr:Mediator of RNA polymerase II transcription subunit 14 [Venturia inaequalis]